MNLSDVKIGDRLRTEKGGVVRVSQVEKTEFGILGTCWWKMDGTPWEKGCATERNYGNIIGRESDMDYAKEIESLKARLAAIEPKPEPKLPTEIGSFVRPNGGSNWYIKTDDCWRSQLGVFTYTDAEILRYCKDGFQVGRVVWEAE